MQISRNLIAGFANSAWTAALGLAVVPFYLQYLGLEAYGLVGFFAAMQALFVVLDFGLAPTVNREVASHSAVGKVEDARRLLHTLALVYWGMAVVIALLGIALAPLIADRWLLSSTLPRSTIVDSLMIMVLVIAFRWPVGLYLGALMGLERLSVASLLGIVTYTVANVGAVLVLAFVSPSLEAFFAWHAAAGIFNVLATRAAAWRAIDRTGRPSVDWQGLRRIWRFSAGMGITAALGIILMQSDRIILSKIVNLEELGKYSLAWIAATSLYIFLTPAFNAVYPRLTVLMAEGNTTAVVRTYKDGTRLLLAVIFPIAAYVSVFANELFILWTGDPLLARSIQPVVGFLLLGTAMNGAMHLPYALQLAAGKSHLPVLINVMLLAAFIPLLWYLAVTYGTVGAAAAWGILNSLYVGVGTWITHRYILKGYGRSWLRGDVLFPLLTSLVIVGLGGFLVQMLDLMIWASLALGAVLVTASFAVVVLLSSSLMVSGRQLLSGIAIQRRLTVE